MLTYIYIHSHDCSRKGELYESRPRITQGVAFVVHPTCVEVPSAELQLVQIRKDGKVEWETDAY